MSPLRRPIALLGLVALLVTAWLLLGGHLSPAEAGVRALVVVAGVRVLDVLATWGLRRVAGSAARHSPRGRVLPREVPAGE